MLHYIDRMELPQWYDENLMIMLVVNPDTIYAYWELSFGQCKALNGWKPVLKLYELPPDKEAESEPRLIRTSPLPPFTDNWYFKNLQPQRRYQAEIGWEQDNHFYTIIKSNIVDVPPAAPVAVPGQVEWRAVAGIAPSQDNKIEYDYRSVEDAVQQLFNTMPFYMGINTGSRS
ncbi:DUF4912 domain-containing protein [Desulfallas sp. Bu1-1]|uniref:DUF4912 domain-containing protein n=1 Tax=Desulfallas sp. Bu1-1 TaxID=2787620 RepID=UPI00189EFAA7|nr:DUF4912 domain-containing protein [Desulfallas sp. Bu1-1]MBF7083958.1 DUF4912 domain-containing protein [Desulfallas sp. Bu1-1]